MPSTYLTQSMTSGGSTTKFTKSLWVKRTGLTQGYIIDSLDDEVAIQFNGDNKLNCFIYHGSSYSTELISTRKFRDTNAWYHIVYAVDYTNATQAHRARVYVNGEEITSWDTETRPGNNSTTFDTFNSSITHYIGNNAGANKPFDGILSHVIHVDGTQYAPTVFGSTDSTTGEWKIDTSPSVTWGTKGYWVLKDGNSVTDASPNTNNWTVANGTLTKTEDCPDNVFATINQLFANDDGDANALTKGNNTYTSTNRSEWNNMAMTLGASTGKYYWEVKYEQLIDASTIYMSSEGVASDLAAANLNLGEGTRSGYGYGWLCGNRNTTSNTRYLKTVNGTPTLTTDSNNTPVAAGDIVGVAWDATNGKLWFHKNGTYIDDTSGNVGNPTTAAYPYHTGMQTGIIYTPWSDVWQNASGSLLIKSYNFGNGYFGTTAVSSAGSNASGNGIFEYDVPTGYTALSTKGLNL